MKWVSEWVNKSLLYNQYKTPSEILILCYLQFKHKVPIIQSQSRDRV